MTLTDQEQPQTLRVPPPKQWFHSLDGVRASCMLLVILAHAAAPFTHFCPSIWYPNAQRNVLADLTFLYAQLITMPAFFMMSGFFARASYFRHGPRQFVRKRLVHILLPFVVAWIVMMACAYTLLNFDPATPERERLDTSFKTFHLWFMYYLMMYLVVAVVWHTWVDRALSPGIKNAIDATIRMLLRSPVGVIGCALLTLAPLTWMRTPLVDTDPNLLPQYGVLAYYFVYFCFGWILQRQPALLQALPRWRWFWMGGSFALTLIFLGGFMRLTASWIGKPFLSLYVWFLLFAVLALFLRWVDRPTKIISFFRDFAYFGYLAHLPVILLLHKLTFEGGLSGAPRFWLVLSCAVLALLLMYQLFVRNTVLGTVLGVQQATTPRATPAIALQGQLP